jgi:hypothetical protein
MSEEVVVIGSAVVPPLDVQVWRIIITSRFIGVNSNNFLVNWRNLGGVEPRKMYLKSWLFVAMWSYMIYSSVLWFLSAQTLKRSLKERFCSVFLVHVRPSILPRAQTHFRIPKQKSAGHSAVVLTLDTMHISIYGLNLMFL